MSQLNSSTPYVERQECEMKEANSELLSKRDEAKKNWAWVGLMGFWVRNGKKGSDKITTTTKSWVSLALRGVSFFGGLAFECTEFCWLSQPSRVFDGRKIFHRIS